MNELKNYKLIQGKLVVASVHAKEDGYYGRGSQMTFSANDVYIDGKKFSGKVQVSGFGLNAVFAGDEIIATGKLRKGYGSSQASISYSKLMLVRHNNSQISDFRRSFSKGIMNSMPEPLSSFALGILVGQRATLPENIKNDLRAVGLTHVIAVSGYNLTIMLRASQRLFKNHSKRLSLSLALALIAVFVLIAGTSASIVRAAIVSMLSIGSSYFGRSFKPINLILLVAAITVWANPFYLWSDLGWYLSFLAFFGVMVLGPGLINRLSKGRELPLMAVIGVETFAAEIMTLPLILCFFGQMSLAGLPANILVVSLVPLAMLLSVLAGIAGIILSPVAGWIAWPAVVLLNFMLDTAHIIASLPRVFIENIGFSVWQMILSYVALIVLVFVLARKTKNTISVKITDKKLII